MSEHDTTTREGVARHIADFCLESELVNPYGGYGGKIREEKGRVVHAVSFCRPRDLDGYVYVYSPKFILVGWQSRYSAGDGKRVFESYQDAERFIGYAFVRFEWDKAQEVPTKEQSDAGD